MLDFFLIERWELDVERWTLASRSQMWDRPSPACRSLLRRLVTPKGIGRRKRRRRKPLAKEAAPRFLILGSAPVSGAGFGLSPKWTFFSPALTLQHLTSQPPSVGAALPGAP